MQTADFGNGNDPADGLHRPRIRRIFVQGQMKAASVVVPTENLVCERLRIFDGHLLEVGAIRVQAVRVRSASRLFDIQIAAKSQTVDRV
jgi:hypothetical protein